MKIQLSAGELVMLLIVSMMSFLANLPEPMLGNLIDRKLILITLVVVVVIAMFRYLQVLLLVVISILAIGANLPEEMATSLGISKFALIASLGALIAVTLLNRMFHLLPKDITESEPVASGETTEVRFANLTEARQNVLTIISKGDLASLEKLLSMNAGINFTLNGTTPLHLAAEKGYSDIVQLLIDHGANLNVENAEKKTPLEVALDKKVFIRTAEILFSASKPYLGKSSQSKSTQSKSTQANLSQAESRRADADLWRDQVQ